LCSHGYWELGLHHREVNDAVEVTVVVEVVEIVDGGRVADVVGNGVDEFVAENVDVASVAVDCVVDVVDVEMLLEAEVDSEVVDVVEEAASDTVEADSVTKVNAESEDPTDVVEVDVTEGMDCGVVEDRELEESSDDAASVDSADVRKVVENSTDIVDEAEIEDVVADCERESVEDNWAVTELGD